MKVACSFVFALLVWAVPAFASVSPDVIVGSPAAGATVATPFLLNATATPCSGQTVGATGYSIDYGVTTIVNASSINVEVAASLGTHTLHVKSWGNTGSACDTDVPITVTAPAPLTNVTVSQPTANAELVSPFTLVASGTECDSQTITAMGFSIDSSANTTIVAGSAMNASVSSATGTHILHVKSWGNQGSGCDTDVPITVAAPAPLTNVTVSQPTANAEVVSPFTLVASGTQCDSQPITAMGFSIDNSANTTVIAGTAINAPVSSATGAHTLHVKSWGNQGSGCDTDVPITVATPAPTSNVTVSQPAANAKLVSPFTLIASGTQCDSQTITAMGFSIDGSANTTIVTGTAMNVPVSSATGTHTLHIKSWGNQGAGCDTDIAINVVPSPVSTLPPSTIAVQSIQTLTNWQANIDTATGANAATAGVTGLTASPSLSGTSREFVTSFVGYGGMRYYVPFGADTSATNFLYDGWVYVPSSATDIANLEMDLNQVMANGDTVIFGFQCDYWNRTWDYTTNAGTPQVPNDQWIRSTSPCNVQNWTTNTWHHVQISYSRDASGNVTYQSVWLDNVEQDINATVPSAFALGWGTTLNTNFQVGSMTPADATNTVYLDDLTIYRW